MKKFRFMVAILFFGFSANSFAFDPTLTMGGALLAALNKAQDLIRQAREAGNDLLLSTGVATQNAIQSAQIAYKDSLQKTMVELKDYEKKALNDLENILTTAEIRGAKEAHDLLIHTQLISDIIPFRNKIPLVGSYFPGFVPPRGEFFPVEVKGNFVFPFNENHLPLLKINEETIKPVSYNTISIKFNVPRHLLVEPVSNSIGITTASLHIPWSRDNHPLRRSRIEQAVFKLEFVSLPINPGKFTLFRSVTESRHEEDYKMSGVFHFDSHADDIEENRSLRLSGAEQEAGWQIIQNTCNFKLVQHIEGEENHDWYNKGYQGGSDVEVIWRARTEHKRFGSSGKIKWAITCKIFRNVPITTIIPEEISSLWGQSLVFSYPIGKWKLVWTRFDGVITEIDKTYLDSIFVNVDARGDSFTIRTYGLGYQL